MGILGDPRENDPAGIRAWNLSQYQPASAATSYPYPSQPSIMGTPVGSTTMPPPPASGGAGLLGAAGNPTGNVPGRWAGSLGMFAGGLFGSPAISAAGLAASRQYREQVAAQQARIQAQQMAQSASVMMGQNQAGFQAGLPGFTQTYGADATKQLIDTRAAANQLRVDSVNEAMQLRQIDAEMRGALNDDERAAFKDTMGKFGAVAEPLRGVGRSASMGLDIIARNGDGARDIEYIQGPALMTAVARTLRPNEAMTVDDNVVIRNAAAQNPQFATLYNDFMNNGILQSEQVAAIKTFLKNQLNTAKAGMSSAKENARGYFSSISGSSKANRAFDAYFTVPEPQTSGSTAIPASVQERFNRSRGL